MIWNFKLQNISIIPNPFQETKRSPLWKEARRASLTDSSNWTLFFMEEPSFSNLHSPSPYWMGSRPPAPPPLHHSAVGGATHTVRFQFYGWHCASTWASSTWVNCKEQTMNPYTLETNCNPRHLILRQSLKECHRSTRSVVLSAMIGGPE